MARKLTVEEKIDRILATEGDAFTRGKGAARIVTYAIANFMADRIAVMIEDGDDETPDDVWRAAESALLDVPNVRPGAFRERAQDGYGGLYARAAESMRALQDRIDAQGPLVPTRATPTNLDDAIRRAFGIHDESEG